MVFAGSSANPSQVVEKKPASQSRPGKFSIPNCKTGKLAAFDVTVTSSRNPTLSLMRPQSLGTHLMRQMNKNNASSMINDHKWG